MSMFQSLILAVVQGITEFLPVSSSGHLNLAQHFLGLSPSLSLDIFLNTATLLSVLFFFRHQFKFFTANIIPIIVGSVPAAVVGVLFKDYFEVIFQNVYLLPVFFIITSVFVFSTRLFRPRDRQISLVQALVIGLFQALAILPGISRAGSTIFAALLVGLSPMTAFNYSFSLFIPASIGALLLDISSIEFQPGYLPAFLLTFLTGLVALNLLKNTLKKGHFWKFSFYTLLLALILPQIL